MYKTNFKSFYSLISPRPLKNVCVRSW